MTDIETLKKSKWIKAKIYIPRSKKCLACPSRAKHIVYCLDDERCHYLCHSHFDCLNKETAA